jgi:hypothetical protein
LLKLHILYFQSLIYERTGQTKQLKLVVKRGCDFTQAPEWYQFFLLEMARILVREGNEQEAIELLQKGLASAEACKSTNVAVSTRRTSL